MKLRKTLTMAALAGAALTLSAGGAHTADPNDCAGIITAYETPAGTIYTDDQDPEPGVPGVTEATWIYLESNGHPGLQKGGYHPMSAVVGEDVTESQGWLDTCNTAHNGSGVDTMLY